MSIESIVKRKIHLKTTKSIKFTGKRLYFLTILTIKNKKKTAYHPK